MSETKKIFRKPIDGGDPRFLYFGFKGEEKHVLFKVYEKHMNIVKNIEIKKDDVWILGFPRSGTTLTQEMLWLLDHDLDFETAKKTRLCFRSLFFEHGLMFSEETMAPLKEELNKSGFNYLDLDTVLSIPSPRHYKTHLCLPFLPDNLLDTAKVVFVARNPKDTLVSMYLFSKMMTWVSEPHDFKTFMKMYLDDKNYFSPFFEHVKQGWNNRNRPNCLMLFYEDVVKDLPSTIRRVAKFLNKEYSEEQYEALHQHLKFDNMKDNPAIQPDDLSRPGHMNKDTEGFIRKGISGSWRDYFDHELNEMFDRWIEKNLADTDLKFPEY